MDGASGPAVSEVLGASGEAVLVDFGKVADDACLVGEAGLSRRIDGTFLPSELGTVCCPEQRRMVS